MTPECRKLFAFQSYSWSLHCPCSLETDSGQQPVSDIDCIQRIEWMHILLPSKWLAIPRIEGDSANWCVCLYGVRIKNVYNHDNE
jgi:hypothetical protein